MITVTLAYSADERMAMPLAASIASAVANFRDPGACLEVIVIDGGLSFLSLTRLFPTLPDSSRFRFCTVTPGTTKTRRLRLGRYGLAAIRRLELSHLLPNHNRVIYLDADTIVEHNLTELWDEAQGDATLWARQDWMFPDMSHPYLRDRRQGLGMLPGDPYFNSGVLVLNLDDWRKENLGAQVMNFLRDKGAHCPWLDQDALNAVFRGRWRPLSARWNRYPAEVLQLESIGIIHYIGADAKPWLEFPEDNLANQRFQHYLQTTKWRTT
jgi:lipopolysaccharide biosynthesis glycosyltransferase